MVCCSVFYMLIFYEITAIKLRGSNQYTQFHKPDKPAVILLLYSFPNSNR